MLQELPATRTHKESIDTMMKLYQSHPMEKWLDPAFTNEIGNEFASTRHDLIDVCIRINVQANLILQTLSTFGTPEQLQYYGPKLGAFALTENTSGVLSGLHLDTTFTENEYDYTINSNESTKKWISQGYYAEFMLVAAVNSENSKDVRFFIVSPESVGVKRSLEQGATFISNRLDMATITFTNASVLKSLCLHKSVKATKREILGGIYYGRYFIAECMNSALIGLTTRMIDKLQSNIKFNELGVIHILREKREEFQMLQTLLTDNRIRILEEKDVQMVNAYKAYCVDQGIDVFVYLQTLLTTHIFDDDVTLQQLLVYKVAEGDTSVLRLSLLLETCKEKPLFALRNFSPYANLMLYQRNMPYIIKNLKSLTDVILHRLIFKNEV